MFTKELQPAKANRRLATSRSSTNVLKVAMEPGLDEFLCDLIL